ncbi:TIGR01777 family oxidoreductase [Aquimarina sp. D1M17]|uniref:TIGR01777 family oxidoreductase n=1 Tax=Aquimarina acroporae TaxID=2937283 RepID=UPI0020BEC13B|nr:TIGR01777 family oxidoreductase [Aquimarina acroporae]MCK8521979.1 TIGR01777 family oxidoreductase [Aquimarina acroporae]
MKVLITGATGMIGQEIVKLCHQANIDVHYLTTRQGKIQDTEDYRGFLWNPKQNEIDVNCFNGVEVIIHLVGATVAKRWTSKYKKEILESRTVSTRLLLNALRDNDHTVRHVISASAIGIYPDSFQNYYMEDSPERDLGFLGEVVQKWESSVLEFGELGIDTSLLRIGLVLSEKGGAFPKMKNPIKLGFGAVFGNGKQWQSWIHVEDLAHMFLHVLKEELIGVFNAVAPNPVSNKKLTYAIAKRLNKRIILPGVPRLTLKMILGEMHILLFSSQRVCSDKISKSGFEFKYDNITSAIHALIP